MNTRDRIVKYVNECDHSPTIREIAQNVNRTHSTVFVHVSILVREGKLRKIKGRVYPSVFHFFPPKRAA